MRFRIDEARDGGRRLVVEPVHEGEDLPEFDGRAVLLDAPTYAGADRLRGRLVLRDGRRCIELDEPFEEPTEYVDVLSG